MIKCYFDGKLKDCNISDCNNCKIFEEMNKHIKPKHCKECGNFGLSEITVFPSLCKRNYLWFQCKGEFGYKSEEQKITVKDVIEYGEKKCEFKVNGVCVCSDCWQFGEECDTTATKCDFLHHWFLSHSEL